MAAKWELYEETGATEFNLISVCKYSFEVNEEQVFAILYKGTIIKLEELPHFEIKEINFFDELPNNVTYTEIYEKILNWYI